MRPAAPMRREAVRVVHTYSRWYDGRRFTFPRLILSMMELTVKSIFEIWSRCPPEKVCDGPVRGSSCAPGGKPLAAEGGLRGREAVRGGSGEGRGAAAERETRESGGRERWVGGRRRQRRTCAVGLDEIPEGGVCNFPPGLLPEEEVLGSRGKGRAGRGSVSGGEGGRGNLRRAVLEGSYEARQDASRDRTSAGTSSSEISKTLPSFMNLIARAETSLPSE